MITSQENFGVRIQDMRQMLVQSSTGAERMLHT